MKELSFDQMESLDGSGGCGQVIAGIAISIIGGALTGGIGAALGASYALGGASDCGRYLDSTYGCIGSCTTD